ncbi:MAG: hypothetical protein LBL91_05820 [Lachnospiraceae bacterium]|jgi:hypothetical protein|nr:hypothetical protein [Lachnospiraceae bacterium]
MKKRKIKMRKSNRYFFLIVALVLLSVSLINVFKSFRINKTTKEEKTLYSFTNAYNLNYAVNLINNRFIPEATLSQGKTYVTGLIKDIDLNMTYTYTPSTSSNINYEYKVVGVVSAVYNSSEVLNRNYTLLDTKLRIFRKWHN